MKNQPEQDAADYPSWGQGPFVQAEETVEGADIEAGAPRPNGNPVLAGSCFNCGN